MKIETNKTTKISNRIVSVLDIGSSKISCLVARIKPDNSIEVIGIGHHASQGVKSGTIVDLNAARAAVGQAVQAAENMASPHLKGQSLKSVFVNVPAPYCLSHNLSVEVRISGHEVTEQDIEHALHQAKSLEVNGEDELIHVVPAAFSIDGHHGIQEPRGMFGQTLGVQVCAITAMTSTLRNISAIVGQNHLEIDGFCASSYASGLSCLVEDERELGCTVVDIGGGTTSIGVFFEGKIVYSDSIPLGGKHVTNDIARGLTTSIADAERIKNLYGGAMASADDDTTLIDVPPIGEETNGQNHHIPKSLLVGIMQPRIEEIFELVRARLDDSGMGQLSGRRVVLTGGGSQLEKICELAQPILDKKIRLGKPRGIKGMAQSTEGPAFSTTAGLLLYAANHMEETAEKPVTEVIKFNFAMPSFSGNVLGKMTHWLKENW